MRAGVDHRRHRRRHAGSHGSKPGEPLDAPFACVGGIPITVVGEHAAQGEMDLAPGVDGGIPPPVPAAVVALLVVPAGAAALLPDAIAEGVLDVGGPAPLGLLLDLVRAHVAGEDGADEAERVVDHVLGGEDDGRVSRGGVGAEDEEEVREAVHGGAEVGLGAAPRTPHVVEAAAVAALDVERVEPLAGFVAVGEDEGVAGHAAFRGRGFAVRPVHGWIVAAWTEGYAPFVDGGEGEGGEVYLWVLEAAEPFGVDDAAFAAEFVVRGEDLPVLFRDDRVHVVDEGFLVFEAAFAGARAGGEVVLEVHLDDGEYELADGPLEPGAPGEEDGRVGFPPFDSFRCKGRLDPAGGTEELGHGFGAVRWFDDFGSHLGGAAAGTEDNHVLVL